MIYIEKNLNDPLLNAICNSVGYNGKKLRVSVIPSDLFTMGSTAWDGGSRTSYAIFNIATMQTAILPNFHPVFDGQVIPNKLKAQSGFIIVQHDVFCGKDMGLTLHVHSDDYKTFELPATATLTQSEQVVLNVTKSLKSFARKEEALRYKVTDTMYETAKNSLITKGLLAANGAITVQGKNVVGTYTLPQTWKLGDDWKPM